MAWGSNSMPITAPMPGRFFFQFQAGVAHGAGGDLENQQLLGKNIRDLVGRNPEKTQFETEPFQVGPGQRCFSQHCAGDGIAAAPTVARAVADGAAGR